MGSIQACTTSSTNRQYLLTRVVSTTLHSRLAKHSATSGAATVFAASGVRPKDWNLSTSRPDALPTFTAVAASFTDGTAMTHSLVLRSAAKL